MLAITIYTMTKNTNIEKEKKMGLKIGDKIKLHSASSMNHGICTITKIRNYKTKGARLYIDSQWGYSFMMWFSNMNYTKV